MKERPILFSAPMVRAILAGTKTQTRRVVKTSREFKEWDATPSDAYDTIVSADGFASFLVAGDHGYTDPVACPYGEPGDRLWVRETWQAIHVSIDPETGHGDDVYAASEIPKDSQGGYWKVAHAATDPEADYHKDERGFTWRPGIHMPRWASRITLGITGVRVERLHAISEADALAEGITRGELGSFGVDAFTRSSTAARAFQELWSKINGAESWDANPFVWVVEFKRVLP